MPRRNRVPHSEVLTLESIAKLDHYQVLGLTEAASSEDIEQALQIAAGVGTSLMRRRVSSRRRAELKPSAF